MITKKTNLGNRAVAQVGFLVIDRHFFPLSDQFLVDFVNLRGHIGPTIVQHGWTRRLAHALPGIPVAQERVEPPGEEARAARHEIARLAVTHYRR